MDKLKKINHILTGGLYINGLREVTKLCMQIASSSEEPLPYYTLASIFSNILHEWDERPLYSQEVEHMEKRILNALKTLINSMIECKEQAMIWEHLNIVLRCFLQKNYIT